MALKETGSENDHPKLPVQPVILDGLVQPSFPFARVFTLFFLRDCLVFTKTGSFGTNAAGTMRGSLGGYSPEAMIAGAIGSLADQYNDEARRSEASKLTAFSPDNMVAAHKRNFKLMYEQVESVEIRGPNFARELRIIVMAGGERHKFRIDRQSASSAKYVTEVFNKFLPGKVIGN